MVWLLGIIILIAVVVCFKKKSTLQKRFQDDTDETEEERVYRLVEEKKNKARELRLPEMITDLYHNQIMNYPDWIRRDDGRDRVPSEVQNIEEIKNDADAKQIKLDISKNTYIFNFESYAITMPNGTRAVHGKLELFLSEKKILAIDMLCDSNEFGETWSPYGLQAFVEGNWVNDFQGLKKSILTLSIKREAKVRNSPERIQDLKDNFNIN